MHIVSRRNFIIFLAAILVVGLGIMAVSQLRKQKEPVPTAYQQDIEKLQTQSQSDNLNDIEEDLIQTDLSDIDSELQDIDQELNQSY